MSKLHDKCLLPPRRERFSHQQIRGDNDSLHCCAEREVTYFGFLVSSALARVHICGRSSRGDLVSLYPVVSRDLVFQVEVVTRSCCLIVDNMSKFVEDLAVLIPIMSKFVPFVKAASEKMSDSNGHFFLDISANRFGGDEGGVTSLRDGGLLWTDA